MNVLFHFLCLYFVDDVTADHTVNRPSRYCVSTYDVYYSDTVTLLQITASPSAQSWQHWSRTGNFLKNIFSNLCLWFEIQGRRTDNLFDWVLNIADII